MSENGRGGVWIIVNRQTRQLVTGKGERFRSKEYASKLDHANLRTILAVYFVTFDVEFQ